MKYKFSYLLLVIFTILFITGCGNNNKHFEQAKENMQNLKNYSMEMNMDMEVKTDGLKLEIPLVIDADVDVENKKTKMTMSITDFLGVDVESINYIDSSDENIIINYSSTDGTNWTKEVTNQNVNQLENIMDAYNIKKVESDDKNYYVYEATVKADAVIQNIKGSNNSEVIDSIDMDSDVVFKYYINKKTKYIEKIVADLDDIATFKNQNSDLEMSISKLKMEIKISNFNELDKVIIPTEVIELTNITKVSCSGKEVDDDIVFETDISGTFKSEKLTNLELIMKYDLTPYLEETDFASAYQYMKSFMESYLSSEFNYEGVSLNIYDENPYMAIQIDIDLNVIDDESYKELQIENIDKDINVSQFKKEFEEMDYLCK